MSPERTPANYYQVLEISPLASELEIRRAYRELSKRYHPDTTELPPETAKVLFQSLHEAYSILSHPEKRSLYDLSLGYSRSLRVPSLPDLSRKSSSAYLDADDRPLSAGEIFALFILSLTLLGCLLIALVVGMLRGETLTIS